MDNLKKSKIFILLIVLYGLVLLRDLYKIILCILGENCRFDEPSTIFINIVSIAVLLLIRQVYEHGKFWAISLGLTLLVQIGKLLHSSELQNFIKITFINEKLYTSSLFLIGSVAFFFYLIFIAKEFLIRAKSVKHIR